MASPTPAQQQQQQQLGGGDSVAKTNSKTVTDTIVGEHTHTIVGYSLIKGIGDGEPIASERFTVGGHEWVLLFYPDGKKSSSSEPGHIPAGPPPLPGGDGAPAVAAGLPPVAAPGLLLAVQHQVPGPGVADPANDGHNPPGPGNAGNMVMPHHAPHHGAQAPVPVQQMARARARDTTNEYAALFVALIGEGPNPQGVVSTSEGKVVRAFHRFTLVDQTGQGRDLTKGRTRDAGAVKISCARQDPNARNCHGYRKFVKRQVLEDPNRGYLHNDTIVIKYTIELVVSSGGALSRSTPQSKADTVKVPVPNLGVDLSNLLTSGTGSDYTVIVEENDASVSIPVHKIILEARSPVFRALLNSSMREGQEGRVVIKHIRAPVFKALLHFIYTDSLPEDLESANLDTAMAQHLLVAADQYELSRLRRICERRLCETVDVETVATTLTLAEQNHAEELKRVCLEFVSRNLGDVMKTDGYKHMTTSCPQLQAELLSVIATTPPVPERHNSTHAAGHRTHAHVRPRDHGDGVDAERRVRPRRGDV